MITVSRFLLSAAVAASVCLSAGAAMAAPGIALVNANVRSGPGTGYSVVDTLTKGDRVEVSSCSGSWCQVHRVGPNGYVFRSLLVNPYYSTAPIYQFPPSSPAQPK